MCALCPFSRVSLLDRRIFTCFNSEAAQFGRSGPRARFTSIYISFLPTTILTLRHKHNITHLFYASCEHRCTSFKLPIKFDLETYHS